MMLSIKKILLLSLLFPAFVHSQEKEVLTLHDIIERIDSNNLLLKSYGFRAAGYQYSADAATAWMPPMAGLGTYMTPYPFQNIMDPRDKGSLMLRMEQEIPNKQKLQATKAYIASQGNIENATREVTLNDYRAQAKQLYYDWLIAIKKIKVIQANESILETMRKIEEARYPYNQTSLSAVYKAQAEVERNRTMLYMPGGDIQKAKGYLNALMNRPGNTDFTIDSSYEPGFEASAQIDTATIAAQRKDVALMNERIRSMQLNIESMKLDRKPSYKVQFDHMTPFSSMMPKAFSVMGMVSIPIVPWSKKMYESNIKGMQFNIQAMESEKANMVRETQGMLMGMQGQILVMQQRIKAIENKVIPSLQKTFDASFITYQENKMSLTTVIDNWEALNMMQLDLLDQKQSLYQMIVAYEKQLYR